MSSHAITTSARPAGKLHVALLGPVTVTCDGADVVLSPLERDLLVILALTPGVAVSTERLVDDLWGTRLPTAPRSRLQGLVSGLRRKVGDAVETRYPGYLVERDRIDRDLDEHERLVRGAQAASSAEERLRLLVAAQDVWRGEALLGISTPGVGPERARLCEQRLALLEARGQAELEVGHHREVVGLLAPSVEQYPFAEQLAGLYMTALYRSNRQADALATYQALRERLADELGADVCAELKELHGQILRGDGVPDVVRAEAEADPYETGRVPAQLPAPDGLFLGREGELLDLDSSDGHVVVSGPGGIGKTTLVVEWAQSSAAHFPDGQLFLDLSGGRSDEDVLGAALVALGVPEAQVPSGVGERIGLYRTVVHDRRILVVADDADSAEQVLAVVPPGPGSRLVVTTRRRLVALAAHHAVTEIVLGPLPPHAARELVQRVAGRERLAGQDTARLVEWCGGWPLLARHVAAKLALRPSQTVEELVAELDGDHAVTVLDDDPRSVDQALQAAYERLTPDAARLFERLGLVTGAFCLHVAAVAAGTLDHRARTLLDELVAQHLVVDAGSGGFHYHEVVRRFARRLASRQELALPGCESGLCTTCRPTEGLVPVSSGQLLEPVPA